MSALFLTICFLKYFFFFLWVHLERRSYQCFLKVYRSCSFDISDFLKERKSLPIMELKNPQLSFCQGVYWWISPAKLSNHANSLFLWFFAPEPEWENQQARQWFFFPLSFYETRHISSILQRYTFCNHSGEFWKHGKRFKLCPTL